MDKVAELTENKRSISNVRLQLYIAIISALLLIVKFIAFYLTQSVAVLTDALESIVNVVAGLISLYSLYISAKPRDINHPYGHGKAEFISAAVEGTLVISAGAIIIYSAIRNLFIPHELQQLNLGMLLIASTAVVNFILGWFSLKQGKKNNSSALIASGKHLKTDTISTVAVIAGLIIISVTGLMWLDSVIAILFALFIIITGYKIIRSSLAGIMDEADMKLLSKMVDVLNKNRSKNWVDLHNLRVIKYGNVLHVDCHLTVPWYFNVNQAHEEIDELGRLIRKDFGDSLELFVHSDGCQYYQCHICFKDDCPVRQHAYKQMLVWTAENILQNEKHGLREVKLQQDESNNRVEKR